MVLDREDGEEKHKNDYLIGKVPQWKTTERWRTEKMKKKQHKDEYFTGKVQQLKTTQKKKH